jgi:hypothetical protein
MKNVSKKIFREELSTRLMPSTLPAYLFHAGFLLGLHFDPEDGSDMFL